MYDRLEYSDDEEQHKEERIDGENHTPHNSFILSEKFQNDLREVLLKCGCIVYFILGITLSIVSLSKELDPNQGNGKSFLKLLLSLMIVFYAVNVTLIIYNHRINATTSGKSARIKNNLLLYVILVPMMVMVIVFLIFEIVEAIVYPDNTDRMTAAMIFIYIMFIISVVILLVDQCAVEISIPSQESNKYINKAAIIMTIVGLLVSLILYLTRHEIFIFKELLQKFYNVTFYSNNTENNDNVTDASSFRLLQTISSFFSPIHVAFLSICISSLWGSLTIPRKGNKVDWSTIPSSVPLKSQLKIPFRALIVGVIVIVLPVVSLPIVNINHKKKPYSELYALFYLIPCFTYSLGIVLSVIQIREIQRWSPSRANSKVIVDRILTWIGSFGQMMFIVNNVSLVVHGIARGDLSSVDITADTLLLINQVFLAAQITLQSIIVHLTLHRTSKMPEPGSAAAKYSPSMGLFCLNIGCLVITINMAPISNVIEFKTISINLFHKGLHMVSNSFSIVYRLHGCLFFGILLSKVNR